VGKIKNESMELSDLSAIEASTQFDIKPTLEMKSGSFLKEWGLCSYDFLPSKIKRATSFHALSCKLKKCVYARIGDAHAKKKKLEEKLIEIMFTMED
jgi:hypothetical protein